MLPLFRVILAPMAITNRLRSSTIVNRLVTNPLVFRLLFTSFVTKRFASQTRLLGAQRRSLAPLPSLSSFPRRSRTRVAARRRVDDRRTRRTGAFYAAAAQAGGGHFLYADFRRRHDLPEWEAALDDAPMRLISHAVIDAEVSEGMRRMRRGSTT